ncbi:MAG TPA: O-antigen ligase family protein [Rhabdochlamydiaceae bacterium]|nr:O-antigen ligase family protein [Rhabdochlamydiaceae bacterium]
MGIIFSCLSIQNIKTLFWEKSRKYLSFFLLIALFSIFHSPYGNEPWSYYPYLFQLLIPSLFFYSIASHEPIKKFVIQSLWIVFASSLIECLLAIIQYFMQQPLGLYKLGEPALFAIISVPDKTLWWLGRFFQTSSFSHEIFRAAGTLPHPNILGCFAGFALFISYFLYLSINKKRNRWFFILPLFLQMFALFVTYSRAAIFGTLLASLLWFGWFFYKKITHVRALLMKTLLCSVLSALFLLPQLIERGGIINYNTCSKNSDQARLVYQAHAVEKMKQHSICGIGFHQYLVSMKENQEKGDAVHNIFLLIATECGLLGLIAFLCFIGSLVWHTFKKLNPLIVTLYAILLFLLFMGCCHYDLIKSQQERILFFLTCGLLALYSEGAPAFSNVKEEQRKTTQIKET